MYVRISRPEKVYMQLCIYGLSSPCISVSSLDIDYRSIYKAPIFLALIQTILYTAQVKKILISTRESFLYYFYIQSRFLECQKSLIKPQVTQIQ
jgi:hypothetical protein